MARLCGGALVVAAVAAFLSLPLFADEAQGPAQYVDKEHAFSIALPEGWTRVSDSRQDVVLKASSPKVREDGAPEADLTVSVSKFSGKIDLASFCEETVSSLSKQLQGYKQVAAGKAAVGTDEGKYIIYTFSADGTSMKGVSVLCIRTKRAVSITCVTALDLYDSYESAFEKMAGSFRFQAPAVLKRDSSQYTSPDNTFSIAFPNGWAISEPADQSAIVQAISPLSDPKDTLRESITVATVADGDSSLDAAAKRIVSDFPKELKVKLDEIVPFKINGHEARRVVCCATTGMPRIAHIIYLTRDRAKLYVITWSFDLEDFAGFDSFCDKVVHTLKFNAQAGGGAPAAGHGRR